MSSTEVTHVPVLIVGGGIVGLSASLFLSAQGIHSLLVERQPGTSFHPRSRSVNTRTMEIYRSIGISDAVRDAGASLAGSWGMYSGTSLKSVIEAKPRSEGKRMPPSLGSLGLSEIGPESGIFGTQDMIEPVLLKTARERGGDLRFYTECLGVEQQEEKVTARLLDRGRNNIFTVTADYLIAADGAKSPIRSQLGVSTTGCGTMGHLLNILFHANLKEFVEKREFSICIIDRPEVVGVFTSINNSDRWVFHLYYDPSKGEKAEDFSPERCKELLKIALGMPDVEVEIKSVLPWEPSVQVASKLQHGRIFLAGDAAHQMPPWAGQGANSGISDVHNLSWKLVAVLKGQAGPKLLETYDVERLPVVKVAAEVSAQRADERGLISVKKNCSTAVSFAKLILLTAGFGYVYSHESRAVVAESTWPLGGVTWKAWSMASLFLSLDGRPGSRAPHVWVEKGGKKISTIDLFGKGFVLLAGSEGAAWVDASHEVKKEVGVMELDGFCVGPNGEVIDKERRWEAAAGISPSGALLVRPDGFVAWRQRRMAPDVLDKLGEAIKRVLRLE